MYYEDKKLRVEGARYAGIVVKNNKLLLVHRIKKGHEYWVLPGGHRRKNEKPGDAVIREIDEETGIKVKNPKLVFEFRDYKKYNYDYYFNCEWISGIRPKLIGEEKDRNSEKDIYEPMWIEISQALNINILPMFAREWIIENYLGRVTIFDIK